MLKDNKIQQKWDKIQKDLTQKFSEGDLLNLDSIIYLIGVQELGQGLQEFSKDDKLNLMHIAVCKLLEPYGYYKFEFLDSEGWPHYQLVEELPNLQPEQQSLLMKEAIVKYFETQEQA